MPVTLVERQARDGSLKIQDLNGSGAGRELTFRLGWRQEDSERGASRALIELYGVVLNAPDRTIGGGNHSKCVFRKYVYMEDLPLDF